MKIHAIGGYNEVGKNMTALEIGEDVILFDDGLFLPAIVGVSEREKVLTEKGMRALGALPDDLYLDRKGLREKVRAILVSHAHLDHVGALPFQAHRYNADVVGTDFTMEVSRILMQDSSLPFKNKTVSLKPNQSHTVKGKKNYKVEFLNMTHSTIQTALIAVHTPEGIVLYANDFKLDNTPVLGEPPNYKRLKELSRIGVKALIVDCLYSTDDRKTPSEKIARGLLEDVLFTTNNHKSGIVITTFSSHIARLKTISDFGRRLNREVIFLGRSLNKYVSAARNIGKAPFINQITLVSYKKQLEKTLKRVQNNRHKYLVVCTGHQGEPGSILDRISRGALPYRLSRDDHIIFSSKTIPTPINEANRGYLEKRLKKFHARIFDNVHVSVLPDTEVIFNDSKGMKIKEIGLIEEEEKKGLKVPAFDPNDLKIKWYDAQVIKHPYKGKIFNIETKSGRNVSITSGHSLFKLEKGEVVAEKGDFLKIGDYLAIPRKYSRYKEVKEINVLDYISVDSPYSIKNDVISYGEHRLFKAHIALDKAFARLLGYYLAEGSAPRHISLVINKRETGLLEEIKSSIQAHFPRNINVAERGNSFEITFGARALKKLFHAWFGENARTKKIPKFVFSASEEFKLNFLGAYINGDGCIDKGTDHFRIRMKTASKRLASDLLYLFSQLGICAKFDHIEEDLRKTIAGNRKVTEKTLSYVIRIQNYEHLSLMKDYLSNKFRIQIENKLLAGAKSIHFPPESLPIEKLDFDEISPKKDTLLYDIKNYRDNSKKVRDHIGRNILMEQSSKIDGFTNKLLNGDLLFDPIISIKISDYEGPVYDFTVPGPQNFIGGFGGIMLHNSGHGGREDLRELIKLTNPQHVIPSHGDVSKLMGGMKLAQEMGYVQNKTVHLMSNGKELNL